MKLTALLPLLGLLIGCGESFYPVRGRVTFEDGTPLTQGTVVFESLGKPGPETISARGEIQPDGSYELSTDGDNDGVPPGKYRVLVAPLVDINSPTPERSIPINRRYSSFTTSGLECDVGSQANEFPIRVSIDVIGRSDR